MTPGERAIQTGRALRDFFIARDISELTNSYQALAEASECSAPQPDHWTDVEYQFNRLFVGPGPLIAPPYASVYLDPEPFVMGETTMNARRIYQMAGLVSPSHLSIPDDHLSLEIDACVRIRSALSLKYVAELAALQRYFLEEHMAAWIPLFIERAIQASPLEKSIWFVVDRLGLWLDSELSSARRFGSHSEGDALYE